jgi:hypothetical protein
MRMQEATQRINEAAETLEWRAQLRALNLAPERPGGQCAACLLLPVPLGVQRLIIPACCCVRLANLLLRAPLQARIP